MCSRYLSGVVAQKAEGQGDNFPSPKFWAVGKLSENFRPQMQNSGPKTPICGQFSGKIKILSTHNHLCQKFAAVY